MLEYQKALEEMMKLDQIDRHIVLVELLEKRKIDFVELSEYYVAFLKKEREKISHQIMPLAMHLSMATEGCLDRDAARKLIYESGYFKGAPIGEQLEKEFNMQSQSK
jgi:hypothetical protein